MRISSLIVWVSLEAKRASPSVGVFMMQNAIEPCVRLWSGSIGLWSYRGDEVIAQKLTPTEKTQVGLPWSRLKT